MYQIKNLQFHPLTLHKSDGQTIHLGPRQTTKIPDDALSQEIQQAARCKQIGLTQEKPETTKPKPNAKSRRRSNK